MTSTIKKQQNVPTLLNGRHVPPGTGTEEKEEPCSVEPINWPTYDVPIDDIPNCFRGSDE